MELKEKRKMIKIIIIEQAEKKNFVQKNIVLNFRQGKTHQTRIEKKIGVCVCVFEPLIEA